MKTKLTLLAFVLLMGLQMATAQDSTKAEMIYSNHVKVNVLPFLVAGSLSGFYEHPISRYTSLGANINYWRQGRNTLDFFFGYESYEMFALTADFRIYLSERAGHMRGFYLAPYMRFRNVRIEEEDFDGIGQFYRILRDRSLGLGIMFGGQLIFKPGISLDFFLGSAYYRWHSIDVEATGTEFLLSEFRAGICLGYAFKKKN